MSRPKPSRNSPLSRVRLPIGATRASMAAERVVVAFWPLFTLVALVFAALAFRIVDVVAPTVLLALGAGIVALAVWALVFGARRFRLPSVQEARNRLDASLSGRPIQALQDTPALGENDPQAAAVWRAHLKRIAERSAQARAPRPDLRVSGRDPFALRLIAGTALILALMFGALSRVGDVSSAVVSPLEASSGGPSWEGWVEPPLYTGRPSLYLNDILQGEFSAPSIKDPVGGDYWRQLVFYKILVDAYPHIRQRIDGAAIDYLNRDKDDQFPIQAVKLDAKAVETVKDQIANSYESIMDHEFREGCGDENCKWCQFVKSRNQEASMRNEKMEELDDH